MFKLNFTSKEMEINIRNFRNVKERSITFDKGVTLLKGDSGVGKTTIFESVSWCLYGGMKDIIPLESVSPDEQKIMVSIKTPQFEIIRTNRPAKVTVMMDKKKYTGDDAISKIRELFGSKGLWETCSYLIQGERNFLLQSSQKEKTDIMKEILFEMGNEDNDWYKEKFEEYKHKMKEKGCVLRGEVDFISSQKGDDEPTKKDIKKASKLEEEVENLSSLIKKRGKIETKIEEYEKFKNIEKEMNESQKYIEEVPFEITRTTLADWRECRDLMEEKDMLESKKQTPTDLSLEEVQELEKQAKINSKIIQKYGPDPKKEIKRRMKKLTKNDDGKRWKKWKKLKDQFNDAYKSLKEMEKKEEKIKGKSLFEKVSKKGVFNLEDWHNTKRLYEEVKERDLKHCPDCGSNLYLDDMGILRNYKENPDIDVDSYIKELKKIKKYYDELELISKEVKDLNLRLKEYEEEPEPPTDEEIDVDKIESEIKELSRYEEMEEYDFPGMNCYLDWRKCMENLESHREEKYWEFRHDSPPGDEYLRAKDTHERCKKFLEEYQIIDSETYHEKKEKLENLNVDIKKIERVKEVIAWQESEQKIRERRIEIGKCDEKIEKASSLSQKIEGMVNKSLELFLADFNNLLNEAISYLFDDMTIYLSLYKKNKVNKKTKPCVNIEIIHKGNKYESFSSFSGGEKNRISLAVTLVFAKICNARFIYLDEFMDFLNNERRIQCLNLIREFCNDKIVVNVCHETVEGYYDNVIELSD